MYLTNNTKNNMQTEIPNTKQAITMLLLYNIIDNFTEDNIHDNVNLLGTYMMEEFPRPSCARYYDDNYNTSYFIDEEQAALDIVEELSITKFIYRSTITEQDLRSLIPKYPDKMFPLAVMKFISRTYIKTDLNPNNCSFFNEFHMRFGYLLVNASQL